MREDHDSSEIWPRYSSHLDSAPVMVAPQRFVSNYEVKCPLVPKSAAIWGRATTVELFGTSVQLTVIQM
jgi:hypothetical protein